MPIEHQAFSHMNKPAGREGLAPTAKPIPVHTVALPEDEAALFEAQMRAQQQTHPDAPQGVQNGLPGVMSDAAVQAQIDRKRVFDKLVLFKGDHITEIRLSGLKFRLKLLSANDNVYVLKQMKTIPPDEQISKLALMVLAAAIVDVNGIRLEEAYAGPAAITDPILQRYFELNQWANPVVNALSTAYHKFQTGVEAEYTNDFLE